MESNPSQGPCGYSSRVCPSALPFLHDDDNFYFPETFFRAALNGVTEKLLSFTHKSLRQCLHSNSFLGLPRQRRGGEKGSQAGATDKQMQENDRAVHNFTRTSSAGRMSLESQHRSLCMRTVFGVSEEEGKAIYLLSLYLLLHLIGHRIL